MTTAVVMDSGLAGFARAPERRVRTYAVGITSLRSIDRDASPLDQTRPALLRLCQIGRNLLGRGWSRFGAQCRKRLLDLGRGERRGSGLVDLPPDRQRRPRWRTMTLTEVVMN